MSRRSGDLGTGKTIVPAGRPAKDLFSAGRFATGYGRYSRCREGRPYPVPQSLRHPPQGDTTGSANDGQLGLTRLASKIDCQQRAATAVRSIVGKHESDIPAGIGLRASLGRYRFPGKVGILNQAATEMDEPFGIGDVEPATSPQPAGMLAAWRLLEQPEFHLWSPRNSPHIIDSIKAETSPRLLPLKPDTGGGGGQTEAEEGDNQQRTGVWTDHKNILKGEHHRGQPVARSYHCILQPMGGSPSGFAFDFLARIGPMPNQFDPYREALVVEQQTVWTDDYEDWSEADRSRVETLLHAAPADAAELDYIRQHTGFARVITVTPDDVERVAAG